MVEKTSEAANESLTPPTPSGSASSSDGGIPTPAMAAEHLPPGTIVDGKYRVERLLGLGAMGLVVAATHLALQEPVALKFLRISGDDAAEHLRRFRKEAMICAKIRSEHLTRVLDVGEWNGVAYMVMELLDGQDLRSLVKSSGLLPVSAVVEYVAQLCEGLAEVHARGVVHRDLKPTNVFVTTTGGPQPLVKLIDFGISKWDMELDEERTRDDAVLGTPKYMAPEQLLGSRSVDARADIWSVGVILYELLAGRAPWRASNLFAIVEHVSRGARHDPPSQFRPEVPASLDAVVRGCLQTELAHRTPDVAELAGDLLAAVGDPRAEAVRERLHAVLARSQSLSDARIAVHVSRPPAPPRRRRWVAIAAAAAGAAVLAGLVWRGSEGSSARAGTSAGQDRAVSAAVVTAPAPRPNAVAPAAPEAALIPAKGASARTLAVRGPAPVLPAAAKAPGAAPPVVEIAPPPPAAPPAPAPLPAAPPRAVNPLEERQ